MTSVAAIKQAHGFDANAVRAMFPILDQSVNGQPLVYLDNAASAQKPAAVIDAMADFLRRDYSNVHRGLHELSNRSTLAYEGAREKVATFLNASRPDEIVFTSGGTDAMNLVAAAMGVDQIGEGDEIILSVAEHHSNIVPWHLLRERKGAVLKWVDIGDDGLIDMDAYRAAFSARTKLVAISGMSNVFGAPAPMKEMARIAHEHDALILFDGCQAAVHLVVDVQDIDCDFFAFTAHKLYGPTGIGVLYGKYDRLAALQPFKGGGEMIDIVEKERITYADPPQRFEAGTPPIIEAVGLGAAIDFLGGLDRTAALEHEITVARQAREALRKLNWVTLFGDSDEAAIASFAVEGAHAHDIGALLDRSGVAVRAGHHCAQPLMDRLGVPSTARASFAIYNTSDDVERFIDALHKARRILS